MMTGTTHRFALCATVLLAACSRGGAEDPAVVLERAASAAQQLQSAAFDATFSYESQEPGLDANGTLVGTLADAGKQLAFTVDADMTMEQEAGVDQTVSVTGDVMVAGENETYLRISSVEGSVLFLPGVGIVPEEMLDTWFSLGGASATGSVSVTQDPSFIALQTQALAVIADRSYEEVDGKRCYAYDVTLDPEKTVTFLERIAQQKGEPFDRQAAASFISSYDVKGTIWIDAATDVIRRITWNIESMGEGPRVNASFSLHLTKHNEPVTITPPADAVPMADALPSASLPAL